MKKAVSQSFLLLLVHVLCQRPTVPPRPMIQLPPAPTSLPVPVKVEVYRRNTASYWFWCFFFFNQTSPTQSCLLPVTVKILRKQNDWNGRTMSNWHRECTNTNTSDCNCLVDYQCPQHGNIITSTQIPVEPKVANTKLSYCYISD